MELIEKIIAWMKSENFIIFKNPGELNIVYIEGVNEDGSDNNDAWDRWNDRRIVFEFDEAGKPKIIYNKQATTEPGKRPTFSANALRNRGIFRIAFGQFVGCWRMGFHKGRPDHPCLRQIPGMQINGYRDANKDGRRTGDLVSSGVGINQHGTKPGFVGRIVDFFSEGCLTARFWSDHILFVRLCQTDTRYQGDKDFAFTTTVIPGDEMNKRFRSDS